MPAAVATIDDATRLLGGPPQTPAEKARFKELEARREEAQRALKAQLVARDSEEIESLRIAIEHGRIIGLEYEDLQPADDLLRKLEAEYAPKTFCDISRLDMEKLQVAPTKESAMAILTRCFGLNKSGGGGFHAEILMEYHYHNWAFCQRSRLCAEKASTFLSIMQVLHTKSCTNPAEKVTERRARQIFEELLERHSQQLPPYRIGVFSQGEVELLRAFAERAFFQHFKMYASVYVSRQDLAVTSHTARGAPQVPSNAAFRLDDEFNPREELGRFEAELQRLEAELQQCESGSANALALKQELREVERQKMFLQVGDFDDLFRDPVDEVAKAAEKVASNVPGKKATTQQTSTDSAPAKSNKDDVATAIDEAMQAHLGVLDDKLALPEI